jgi:osmotically inducible lipoprotein OsmB
VRSLSIALGTAALLSLAGCGHSTGERVLSGGGIGALGGAGIAAATDGNPLTGALVGGGLGVAAGALVDADRRRHDRYDRYDRYDRGHYRGRDRYYR